MKRHTMGTLPMLPHRCCLLLLLLRRRIPIHLVQRDFRMRMLWWRGVPLRRGVCSGVMPFERRWMCMRVREETNKYSSRLQWRE